MKFSEIHSCSCCKAAVHLLGVPGLVPTMPTVLPNLVMSPHPLDGKPFSASRCLLNMTWKVFPGLGFPHQPGCLPPHGLSHSQHTVSCFSPPPFGVGVAFARSIHSPFIVQPLFIFCNSGKHHFSSCSVKAFWPSYHLHALTHPPTSAVRPPMPCTSL